MKLIYFVVATLFSALLAMIIVSHQNNLYNKVLNENLSKVNNAIQNSISTSIISMESLSSHICLNKKTIHVKNFDLVAERILRLNDKILTLGLAPNGIVGDQIYPKKYYNNIYNHDVSVDDSRQKGYKVSIENEYTILGPLVLKQTNRLGYILRKPLYNSNEYLGFIFIAYEKDDFLSLTDFDFDFKLLGYNPDSETNYIIYSNGALSNNTLFNEIKVHGTTYTIILNEYNIKQSFWVIFSFLSFVLSSLFYCMLKYSDYLKTQKKLAHIDPLTGLYNRRALEQYIPHKVISLAIIDIDHFKMINDTYGHLCGDIILQQFSKELLKSFRTTDLVVRFGGEEFVVIMEGTSLTFAYDSCERFRKSISLLPFGTNSDIKLTCSIGIASEEKNNINNVINVNDILNKADTALYKAKRNGRNKIEI